MSAVLVRSNSGAGERARFDTLPTLADRNMPLSQLGVRVGSRDTICRSISNGRSAE